METQYRKANVAKIDVSVPAMYESDFSFLVVRFEAITRESLTKELSHLAGSTAPLEFICL